MLKKEIRKKSPFYYIKKIFHFKIYFRRGTTQHVWDLFVYLKMENCTKICLQTIGSVRGHSGSWPRQYMSRLGLLESSLLIGTFINVIHAIPIFAINAVCTINNIINFSFSYILRDVIKNYWTKFWNYLSIIKETFLFFIIIISIPFN